jgi:hypothetical protein
MNQYNLEAMISRFEEKITYIVEEKIYKDLKPLLPLSMSNDNNTKTRDFDVDNTTFITSENKKKVRKLGKIMPSIDKNLNELSNDYDAVFCDMV